jgi:tRNA(Arg) A34 adenosine deaminase TadA
MSDLKFLKIAVEEAKKALGSDNKFGAVVVLDGEIIAQDYNHTEENSDPSAHAEVSALRKACKKIGSQNVDGATLYASHEPCMMCLCCAAWANVERIVFGHRADELTEDMYEFSGAEFRDIASRLQRKIKVEYVEIDD